MNVHRTQLKAEHTEHFNELLNKGGAEKNIRILTYCKIFVKRFFKQPYDVVDMQQEVIKSLITQAYQETKNTSSNQDQKSNTE